MTTEMQIQNCPRCANQATGLLPVDPGMRLILQNGGANADLPAKVCEGCYAELTSSISQGVKLRLEQQAKEKNRQMLWKSRVNLVKHARQMMAQKAYSEAAISYEKYIKVLELSFDSKPGGLNPQIFGNSSRSKELTVIATTYWDLLRIYDTNPAYRDRMMVAARKLAEFIPYSPIFPDVVKRSQQFLGSAKNPDVVKEFLRLAKAGGGRCFIAGAAFYPQHECVHDLRRFRDQILKQHPLGRRLVLYYYLNARPIAQGLNKYPQLKPFARMGLNFIRRIVNLFS